MTAAHSYRSNLMNTELKRLNVELSAHCSYACESCPNTYMSREKGHMSPDLFSSIAAEIDGRVSKVFLWNYGEPLLNPSAPEMIEETRARTFATVLSTTGATFSRMKDHQFLTALDELIVSINGFTPEVYSFHQKGGNLENVLNGLEKVKDVMSSSDTTYVLQTVVNKQNVEQLDEAERFAREFGFDRIDFKTFNVMDNKKETFDKFVPEDSAYSRYATPSRPRIIDPCMNWMVINWNGDVNPCCWDYTGKHVLGNVSTDGVFGVWESIVARNHRDRMERGDYYDICTNCGLDSNVAKRTEITQR